MPGLLSFLMLWPDPARAQEASDSSLLHALQSVPIGAHIRLRTVGKSTLEGRLAQVTETRLVIVDGQREQRADVERVAAVFLRHHRAKAGAITGGIAGAVGLGGFVGLLSVGLCECDAGPSEFFEGFSYGAAIGAVAGTLAGTVIGSFVHGWRLHWSREAGFVGTEPVQRAALAGPSGWGATVSAGAGTSAFGTSGTQTLLSARIDRPSAGGRRVAVELGYDHMPREERVTSFDVGGSISTKRHVRTGHGTHLSLVARAPMDVRGDAYWMVDAGMAQWTRHHRFESIPPSTADGSFVDENVWPIFGVGVGVRFGHLTTDFRVRAPVAFAGGAGTMISFTGGWRVR